MGKIIYVLNFAIAALSGLFIGAFINAGPNAGLITVFSSLIAEVKNILRDPISLLKNSKGIFGIIGLALAFVDIILSIFSGLVGLISASFGFIGMLLLANTNQQAIGVVLLFLGGGLSVFGPDNQSHSRLY